MCLCSVATERENRRDLGGGEGGGWCMWSLLAAFPKKLDAVFLRVACVCVCARLYSACVCVFVCECVFVHCTSVSSPGCTATCAAVLFRPNIELK